MADQVLTQAAIDAMIAGDADAADQADTDATEALAGVAADLAADPAAAEGDAAPEESDQAEVAAEDADPKARFKTFAVSASQETSENDEPSAAVAAGADPVAEADPAADTDSQMAPPPAPEAPPVIAAPTEPDQATLGRIQALEAELVEAKAAAEHLGQSFSAMMQHVTAVTNAVNQMMGGLGATPGYDALRSFVCPACGDGGHVSVPLTCTSCGETTETGAWPDEG